MGVADQSRALLIKWRLVPFRKGTKVLFTNEVMLCYKMDYYFLTTDATVYVGGLDEKVSETVLWELFLQAGPVGI